MSAALHQLSSMVEMLEALQLDCEARNDFAPFPLVSEGYRHRIRDLNVDIREYVQTQEATIKQS